MQSQQLLLKSYLVVSEYEGTGYIISSYDDYEEAEKETHRLLEVYTVYWEDSHLELYEKLMGFQTYKVHESCKYGFFPCKTQVTNGTYNVAIMFTNSEGFSLEAFKFERANTIYAVGFPEEDKHKFFKDNSYLLAN